MKGEVPVSVDFDFIIRIGVAGLLGAMIGIEREFDRRSWIKDSFPRSGRKCVNNGCFEICLSDIIMKSIRL